MAATRQQREELEPLHLADAPAVTGMTAGQREHDEGGDQPVRVAPRRERPSAATPQRSAAIARSRRSSISRLMPNSWTSGRATAWIPWKMQAIATDAGDEQAGRPAWAHADAPRHALADLGEHVGEHEHEQQRLHHASAARTRGRSCGGRRGRAAAAPRRRPRCRWVGVRSMKSRKRRSPRITRRSFPVRLMNTVSSVGSSADTVAQPGNPVLASAERRPGPAGPWWHGPGRGRSRRPRGCW